MHDAIVETSARRFAATCRQHIEREIAAAKINPRECRMVVLPEGETRILRGPRVLLKWRVEFDTDRGAFVLRFWRRQE